MNKSTTADQSNTLSGTWANINDFDLAVTANQKWLINYDLVVSGNNTGGIKLQCIGPASPSLNAWTIIANTSSASGFRGEGSTGTTYLTSSSGLITVANTILPVRICMTFTNGANAGTVKLQFAPITNGQSVSIHKGSRIVSMLET